MQKHNSEAENKEWMEKMLALLASISEADAEGVKKHFLSYLEGKITLAELEEISPDLLNRSAQLAYMHLKNGRYAEAANIFETLCFLDSKNVLYRTALASSFQKSDKWDEALAHYSIALELDPSELSARVNRAEILFQLGYYNESVSELELALKNPKANREAWIARAKALMKNIVIEREKLGIPASESRLFND